MDVPVFCARLRSSAAAIAAVLEGLDDDSARWRPQPGAWSVVEIVNHLADEEDEDFRARLASTLDDPSAAWAPIDPEGAVVSRGHGERDLGPSLERFIDERGATLQWLASLEAPDFDRAHEHPALGRLRAGDLLAAWAAHDLLHLKQLTQRLVELTRRDAEPFHIAYAEP